jgi:hypothetical protein
VTAHAAHLGLVEVRVADTSRSAPHIARRARSFAFGIWVSTALFLAGAGVLVLATLSDDIPPRGFGFRGWVLMVSALWTLVGARIALRQPRNAVGWLLLSGGWLWAVTSLFEEYATYAYVRLDFSLPFVPTLLWFNTLTPTLVAGCSAVAMLLIPDGALRSSRERAAAIGVVLLTLTVAAGYALVLTRLLDALYVLRGLIVVLPAGILFVRLRGAVGERRRQLRWIVGAALASSIAFLLNALVRGDPLIQLFEIGALAFVPVAFAVAIARYHLYDMDAILSRAFVYGGATAILGGFSAVSLLVGQRLVVVLTGQRSDVALILTVLLVAMAIAPLEARLQRVVDGWRRPAILGAIGLRSLRAELEAHVRLTDPDRLLEQLLIECVAAFDAVGGALELDVDGRPQTVRTVGRWTGEPRLVVIVRGTGRLARIQLAARTSGAEYTRSQRKELGEVAELVARSLAAPTRVPASAVRQV